MLLLRKGYVREILNADIMAKKTHITAPADRLNGVIIEKDGKQYLDTGIGLILEMDKKADSNVKYAETDFTDCDHDRWAGHYRFIKETLEACEIFSRRIAEKGSIRIRIKDKEITDEYSRCGIIPQDKELEVISDEFPFRFTIPKDTLCPEDKHELFNGREIEAICSFEQFNWLKTNINKTIILTPRTVEKGAMPQVGDICQGYIINCHEIHGIFVECRGWRGLVYKQLLHNTFAEECRNGTIGRIYPVAGKIEVQIENITENGISMIPTAQTTSSGPQATDKDIELRISSINAADMKMHVSWQGKELPVFTSKEDVLHLRNRIRNGIYKVSEKIKGKVTSGNGFTSFTTSLGTVEYGINIGDKVQCKIDNNLIIVPDNKGSERVYLIKKKEGLHPEIENFCRTKGITLEARCCGITPYGDPLFSIKEIMTELEEQIIGQQITAEVLDVTKDCIIWKYGNLIQCIPLQLTTMIYSPGDKICLSSARGKKRIEYKIDESNITWDGVDLKSGDIINVRILEESTGRHHVIAYGNCVGTFMSDTKYEKGSEVNVKVVYFNLEGKRLDCIDVGTACIPAGKISGATVHTISHLTGQYWWVRYSGNIYLMYLENEYPAYICKFLIPNDSDVTLEITSDKEHILRAVHEYDHSAISSLDIDTDSEIGACIAGKISEGFILSYKGVYCLMPFNRVDWNSHIYVDNETYHIGKNLKVRVTRKNENIIILSHKDVIDNHWESAILKTGDEITCRILYIREDGAAIVKYDDLAGIIEKDYLSWFSFIKTDRFSPGTEINAKVREINIESRNLRLRATCKESPWKLDFKAGDKVKVTVDEVYGSSITVRTDNGLEGSMTIEDLTSLPYEDCHDIVRSGDTFDAEITGRHDNEHKITFRKTGINDISQRSGMVPGQIIEKAKVISISKGEVYFDLGGNICGILPNRLIHEMVDGYRTGEPLDNIIYPGQTMDVRICRVVQEEKDTYVTGTDGSIFNNIPAGQMKGTVESKSDDHMTVRFRHDEHEHLARIDYRVLECRYDYIRHEIGTEITFMLTDLDKKEWIYSGRTLGLGQSPWTSKGHPHEGDVIDAEVIGIGSKGEAVLAVGDITCSLSGTSLLTDTPWIPCEDSQHGLNAGTGIKVTVAEYNGAKRHIRIIPYICRHQEDIETGNLTVKHVADDGLYAYCDTYDCCCFVPKEELYWCPVGKVGNLFEAEDTFVGRLIRYDHSSGMPVMSRKRLLAHAESRIAVGDIIEGTVRKVTSDAIVLLFGTFESVISLKDLSWDPSESLDDDHIERCFKTGDTVRAKVITRNQDDVTMSVREASFNPWIYCSLEGKTAQAKITARGKDWLVAEYGTLFKTVIRTWPQDLDPKTGDVAAVRFHDLDRMNGHIEGTLINILPEDFRSHVVPESNIRCHVTDVTDSSVEVRTIEGDWSGYMPTDEWSWDKDDAPSERHIGNEINAKVIDIDYSTLTVTLSRRRAEGLPVEMCPVSVGETAEVMIKDVHTGTSKDSLFVSCPELPYLKGSVPHKELGWLKSEKDASGYRPGDRIRVLITGIDYKNINFKASIRKLTEDTRKISDIMVNEKLEVTINRFVPQKFYADVTYGKHPGILLLNEEYWSNIDGLSNFFTVGREIEAEYQGLEGNKMRFVMPAGEYSFDWKEDIAAGSTIKVKVIQIMSSGIMVWYKGLVIKINRADLTWSPKTLDIEHEFEIDEIIEVLIEGFDAENRKIRLSRKKLLANPMELLKDSLASGSTIPMIIRKISESGIIGEYQGATCRLPYNDTAVLIQQKHIDGIPVEVIVESIDDHYINVHLNEETIKESDEFIIGYGYWGKVISIDGYELTLDVRGYHAKALIDLQTLSGSAIETIYKIGERYWFIIESLDIASNQLIMTTVRPEAKDEWFMKQDEGTEFDADIVKVTHKMITVFAKGMYFDFDKDQISRFDLPNAKLMYSAGQVIRLKLMSKSPLEVIVVDTSLDFEEAGLKTGDTVEGDVVFFRQQDKTIYIKDDKGFLYTMKLSDHFRQPYVQLFFHNTGIHISNLTIKEIDQPGKRIIVEPERSENMTERIYDKIKDGDIVSAVVEGTHGYYGYILKYEDWYLLLNLKEIPAGKTYAEGDTLYVRVININRADNTAFVSVKHLKRDPIISLQPGNKVNIEYLDIIDKAKGECRIRVDGKFDCLCISDSSLENRIGTKDSVFIQKTDVSGRVTYISHSEPDLSKPLPGEHVEFTIISYDQTKKEYKVKVTREGKTSGGTMAENAMLWYSVFHPHLIGFKGKAVITENRTGNLSVNARCLTADPLIYLKERNRVNATVIGHDKYIGYLVSFESSLGIVSDKELLWQLCELRGLFWSPGQTVDICLMEANRHGTLSCSHKRTYRNPFLDHTVQVNETYKATVRRTNNYTIPAIVVEIGDTGIEAIIDADSSKQFFSRGTEIRLPKAGKKIRRIRITDIRQMSSEYKWTQKITAVIESVD